MRNHKGLRRRWLSVDETGLWTDILEWESEEIALRVAAEVTKAPDFHPFMQMIDSETFTLRYSNVRWQMEH